MRYAESFLATVQDTGKATTNPNAAATRMADTEPYPIVKAATTAEPASVDPIKMCNISIRTIISVLPKRFPLVH